MFFCFLAYVLFVVPSLHFFLLGTDATCCVCVCVCVCVLLLLLLLSLIFFRAFLYQCFKHELDYS